MQPPLPIHLARRALEACGRRNVKPLESFKRAWVHNDDIGFVHSDLPAKIKLSAFSFQKYGMLDGYVAQVSADAVDQSDARGTGAPSASGAAESLLYRALIHLDSQVLDSGPQRHELIPGMRVSAEIKLGRRSVMEYLFSPIAKAFHEAGRER